jgi:hypothetical protein
MRRPKPNALDEAANLVKGATADELAATKPVAELTAADIKDDPELGARLESACHLALNALEDTLLLAGDLAANAALRKDKLLAAQVIIAAQTKVDETRLRAQAIKKEPVDHLAAMKAIREKNPHLYKLRDAREREHQAALQSEETSANSDAERKGKGLV